MGKLGDHPHIVPVFDIGEEANGQPYIVAQFMPGGDVEGVIQKSEDRRLPLDQVMRLAQEICLGLEHAHSHGVIHRDLKPGNVWLAGDGTAKIGDFGLAVAIDQTRLTREGMMVGTVAYMPPEQPTGGEVTARSDLYSLGCMLYELVTGRPPFLGGEAVAIIGQHLNTPPVAPTWHRPDCPPGLEALILRLLEKDASKRPASASEVGNSLASIGDGPPVTAGSPLATNIAADPTYRTVFVGREQELRQLQNAFDAALSGQGALVMVVGEPGIGKTSICEQLATFVTLRGGKPLVGHCYEEGSLSLPYLPFVEAVRSYVLQRDADGLKVDLGNGAGEVARIVSEVRDKVQVELRPPGDPEDDRWRLYQTVTGFLRNASSVQPLLIVLEDLHDADRGTLDLLVHVARNLQGARLLIIGTYRDVEVDRAHPLSGTLAELRRASTFQRIPLRGLTVEEVHRMMGLIRGQEVPWGRAEAIHRQTEGNPLFIQEVLRYLVEEGLVVREEGRYSRMDDGAPDAGIPEGLREVIGKRLSRLSDKANQVLAVSAVFGREFRLDVLEKVAGLPVDEVESALGEASERAVVEERTALGAVVTYRFTHAFFRQTLYEETIAPRRIRLHQQVARALESVYGRRLEEHAAELAEHFAHSSDPENLRKAVAYGENAAQRARSVYAHGEAVRHLERALEVQCVLDPDDNARRCDLLLQLGWVQRDAGELTRVVSETAPQAFALAEALGDGERAYEASLHGLLSVHTAGGGGTTWRTAQYQDWAERAGRYAQPGSPQQALVGSVRANMLWAEGEYDAAWAGMQEVLSLLRTAQDWMTYLPGSTTVAGGIGWVGLPRFERARLRVAEQTEALIREAAANGEARAYTALHSVGAVFLAWGYRERADPLWEMVRLWADRTSLPGAVICAAVQEVLRATLDGDLEGALKAAEQFTIKAQAVGIPQAVLRYGPRCVINARIYLGRAGEVLAAVPELPDGARLADFARMAGPRSLALAHLGRSDEDREVLNRTLARLSAEEPIDVIPTANLLELLEAAVITNHHEAAAALRPALDGLEELCAFGQSASGMCVARHLGGVATMLGEPEKARVYYRKAIEVCERIRFRPELALTRLQLAELLLDHYPEEKAEALEHLDFAIAEFREMKMQRASWKLLMTSRCKSGQRRDQATFVAACRRLGRPGRRSAGSSPPWAGATHRSAA